MGGWTFAQGKEAEQTLGTAVAAGSTQIGLIGADAIFNAGELLFIGEADGSGAEFLGAVTDATPTQLTFTLAVKAAKASGAKLWRPVTSLDLHGEAGQPLVRRIRSGVAAERSLGGVIYAIRAAEPLTQIDWKLEELTPSTENALAAWLDAASQGGLAPFTIVEPDRTLTAVREAGGDASRTRRGGGRRALDLSLWIEADGEYR